MACGAQTWRSSSLVATLSSYLKRATLAQHHRPIEPLFRLKAYLLLLWLRRSTWSNDSSSSLLCSGQILPWFCRTMSKTYRSHLLQDLRELWHQLSSGHCWRILLLSTYSLLSISGRYQAQLWSLSRRMPSKCLLHCSMTLYNQALIQPKWHYRCWRRSHHSELKSKACWASDECKLRLSETSWQSHYSNLCGSSRCHKLSPQDN